MKPFAKPWMALLLAGFLLVTLSSVAHAVSLSQESLPGNEVCLACHQTPGQILTLDNGEQLYVTILPEEYGKSVHAKNGVACAMCHSDMFGYPHPAKDLSSLRAYRKQYQNTCKVCHADKYELDSVHRRAYESGNELAPTCIDCHNPHTQAQVKDEQGNLIPEELGKSPEVCLQCHFGIYQEYSQSVHGKAAREGNPDVPVCITCHGLHVIEDPTTTQFRLASPKMCGECHSNPEIMNKYGLSTDVYNTYVADFHGSTVTLFERISPDQQTNKAVCYDCHGVHNIGDVDDPMVGLGMKQNMLKACQKCHPDATENFPDSWMSHYRPDREKFPLVYYVNLFYKIFIPLVLGGMAVFVASDIFYRARRALSRRKPAQPVQPAAEPPQTPEPSETAQETGKEE